MKKVIDFIKPAVILLLVAAVVALVLGGVNALTAETIENNDRVKVENAMKAVLPADSYEQFAAEDVPAGLDALYAAEGGGWVAQVTESGSQGNVTMMVGVSADLTCTGVSITSSSETAGLGAIASQQSEKGDAFRSQFVGLTSPVAVDKDGGQIDSISGATITSRAVSTGVTAALDACADLG